MARYTDHHIIGLPSSKPEYARCFHELRRRRHWEIDAHRLCGGWQSDTCNHSAGIFSFEPDFVVPRAYAGEGEIAVFVDEFLLWNEVAGPPFGFGGDAPSGCGLVVGTDGDPFDIQSAAHDEFDLNRRIGRDSMDDLMFRSISIEGGENNIRN